MPINSSLKFPLIAASVCVPFPMPFFASTIPLRREWTKDVFLPLEYCQVDETGAVVDQVEEAVHIGVTSNLDLLTAPGSVSGTISLASASFTQLSYKLCRRTISVNLGLSGEGGERRPSWRTGWAIGNARGVEKLTESQGTEVRASVLRGFLWSGFS